MDMLSDILQYLLAAAADHYEALAFRRLAAQHGEGLLRHVDLKRIGKPSDAAGGKKVDRLFVHLALKKLSC